MRKTVQQFDIKGLRFLAYSRDQAQLMHDGLTEEQLRAWGRTMSPLIAQAGDRKSQADIGEVPLDTAGIYARRRSQSIGEATGSAPDGEGVYARRAREVRAHRHAQAPDLRRGDPNASVVMPEGAAQVYASRRTAWLATVGLPR